MRLDFAGGWTDVPPFSAREGGVAVNAAIRLFARATVEPGGRSVRLCSEDLGERVELAAGAAPPLEGRLGLLGAALRVMPAAGPLTLTTRCGAPIGGGLGSSGALDVAMVGALAAATGISLAPHELAERAWRLEAVEARVPGGKQDQYSAALGGFNLLTFRDPEVTVDPLRLDPATAAELEHRLVLCYTGASRFSGSTIGRVMAEYEAGNAAVGNALRRLRDVACRMADALRAGDLARMGRLLSENWTQQQALDAGMRTAEMAELEDAMQRTGALGGKAAGSGAGGCMFFLAPDAATASRMRTAAAGAGAVVFPVRWASEGACAC